MLYLKLLKAVLGESGRLIYEIDASAPAAQQEEIAAPVIQNSQAQNTVNYGQTHAQPQSENIYASASYFNTEYTFDNFVKGKNNEFATAAAQSICNKPGAQYNPLMIYGGVGLGKRILYRL